MTGLPKIRLQKLHLYSHPWIYWNEVEKPAEKLRPGTVVDVVDRKGSWVGRGFYNAHARVRVRVVTRDAKQAVDESFIASRLTRAIGFRKNVLRLDTVTDAYRLVHSEGDGLSGLVVDRFGSLLVIEYFSAGCFRFRKVIEAVLREQFPNSSFYSYVQKHVQKQESFDFKEEAPPEPVVVSEHGVKFKVTPGIKHKTGFFLDQRENRKAITQCTHGGKVLDLCCYSGAFGVYAKTLGKAKQVVGVDRDEDALKLARENAGLNQTEIEYVQADIYAWLEGAIAREEKFDVVVLDSSKQTRSVEKVGLALKNYTRMNILAMQVVAEGGILFTGSCTGIVKESEFLNVLRVAALHTRSTFQIFQITGAGADHPYLIEAPEGRYLKAVWGRVG